MTMNAPPSPPRDTRALVVGLTGGIGSGKSAATERFAHLGAAVVDTDGIAHQLTGPEGAAMPLLVDAFGDDIQRDDGALDRARMRELVFSDPNARQRLESILHPMIRAESERLCQTATSAYVILAVPLLVESGTYRDRCDRVCVVDCPPALQLSRVRQRNGLTEARIRSIMDAQASREQRLAIADDVIDNSHGLDALTARVAELDRRYRDLAAKRGQASPDA